MCSRGASRSHACQTWCVDHALLRIPLWTAAMNDRAALHAALLRLAYAISVLSQKARTIGCCLNPGRLQGKQASE